MGNGWAKFAALSTAVAALFIITMWQVCAAGSSKYVPPALRTNRSSFVPAYVRRLRGLLNKLVESNIQTLVSEVNTLYNEIGRSLVANTVAKEIIKVRSISCGCCDDYDAKCVASNSKWHPFKVSRVHSQDSKSIQPLFVLQQSFMLPYRVHCHGALCFALSFTLTCNYRQCCDAHALRLVAGHIWVHCKDEILFILWCSISLCPVAWHLAWDHFLHVLFFW